LDTPHCIYANHPSKPPTNRRLEQQKLDPRLCCLLPFSVFKHIEFQFPFQFVISEASACKGDGAAFEIQYREIIMRIC